MKAHTETQKLFGRYHDLTLLILGFLLTTLVGGFLTYWYQELAWQREDRSKLRQEEISRTGAVFDEVSKLLDRRIFRLRNVQWALEENASAPDLAARREQYRAVVAEWNESLNRQLALTERYFGPELRQELEGSIQEGFRELHSELVAVLKQPSPEAVASLKKHIDDFNPPTLRLQFAST